jgi:hypothetical protein
MGSLLLRSHHAPAPHWIHAPLGSLPLQHPTPQALLGPSSAWDDQIHTLLGSPLPGPYWIPTPPRTPSLGARQHLSMRQPHTPAHQDPCPSGGARPQLYRLSRQPPQQAHTGATTRGLQTCLRDTHRTEC